MDIIITGAGGFLGQALASALASNPDVKLLTLVDIVEPPRPTAKTSSEVNCVKADLTDRRSCDNLFTSNLTHAYLLHGLMSGASEDNFELGLSVNIDATRLIFDRLRKVNQGVKVIFTSSCAVYGPQGSEPVTEALLPQPASSYGSQKLICEILLNDLSRRDFLDGRIVRLPTIIVRPGKPSGAASSFCSGIIREPLSGQQAQLPVSPDLPVWVCSTRAIVENLVLAKDIPKEKFGGSRVVNLPGVTITVAEMLDALLAVGGQQALTLVQHKKDPRIEEIVYSWAYRYDVKRALEIGFVAADSLAKRIVEEFVEDYL